MEQTILTVSEINSYIFGLLDRDTRLCQIAVRGEISNYKRYPSGHAYFTLKDEQSSIKCVMFKSSFLRLRFTPQNGMKIVAVGKITVYPRDGVYQLYCASLMMDGIGDLYAAFEQLKARLAAQGLFAQEHKKKIPAYPRTIGVITSSAGAAVHDIIRILSRRYPVATVRLLPVRVQGEEAPGEIAAAIQYANRFHLADILIVGRGGGSLEDLWAFNDEKVAYAIYNSDIPVISAVGHEPDVTISDYVADLRAATPTNGAELAVPDRDAILQYLDSISSRAQSAIHASIQRAEQRLDMAGHEMKLYSPLNQLAQQEAVLQRMNERLYAAQRAILHSCSMRFTECAAKMDAMSPLKVLGRGYAIVYGSRGKVVTSTREVQPGDSVRIQMNDGILWADISQIGDNEHAAD